MQSKRSARPRHVARLAAHRRRKPHRLERYQRQARRVRVWEETDELEYSAFGGISSRFGGRVGEGLSGISKALEQPDEAAVRHLEHWRHARLCVEKGRQLAEGGSKELGPMQRVGEVVHAWDADGSGD